LYRVLAALLVLVAAALAWSHFGATRELALPDVWRTIPGVAARAGIGIVAALMGVAGGELLIPTIVLLYGVDIKIAGSLRPLQPRRELHRARRQPMVRRGDGRCINPRDAVRRTAARGRALVLIPLLMILLLASAIKVGRHK
jgi:hypothetical protein